MKNRYLLLALLLVLGLSNPTLAQKKARKSRAAHTEQVASGQVMPTWESINQRGYPQWFNDAKLGIFIHWGLYSVPAYASKEGYAEWFYRGLMTGQHDRKEVMQRYADTNASPFEQYSALKDHWHAELWNPDQWAQLFKDAGAQYILLVTKHHDGYCLWDNKTTYDERENWNSVLSGPKRDICAELSEAVRAKGIRFGAYYSLPEWTNRHHIWMEHPDDSIADYVDNHMIPQLKDMVTRYRPEVLFTDGEWNNKASDFHAAELISWYYNTIGPDAIVNNRWGSGEQHGFRTPEYSGGITTTDRPWAECRGLGRSFGYNRNESLDNYLSSDELIQHFVQLVSAGGGMTLNVGPMADGTIPMLQQERLLDLGNWLKTNGEAIYGTRPWIDTVFSKVNNKTLYSVVPRFNAMHGVKIERKDDVINFDWVRNSPDRAITYDNFSAIWNGTIIAPEDGKYTFRLSADDSATFSINDIDQGTSTTLITSIKDTQYVEVSLQKGRRYLAFVNFHEQDLEARCSLEWKRASDATFVPVKALGGWEANYFCSKPYVCFTTKGKDLYAIVLGWKGDFMIGYGGDVPSDMRVSMLGCDKSIRWSYDKDNQFVTIHTDNLDYSDISQGRAAWAFKLEGILR